MESNSDNVSRSRVANKPDGTSIGGPTGARTGQLAVDELSFFPSSAASHPAYVAHPREGIFPGLPSNPRTYESPWYSIPSGAKYNMVGYFGGCVFDKDLKRWKKAFHVDSAGKIAISGQNEFEEVRHLSSARGQVNAALSEIGKFALAAGKLYVQVLCDDANGETRTPRAVTMSGFWLGKEKFVTCAHFTDMPKDANLVETLKELADSNSNSPRAFVSTCSKAQDDETVDDCEQAWPVYLLSISRASDVAVFGLCPEAASTKGYPSHYVEPSDLVSLENMNFSSNNAPSGVHPALCMNLFTVYYPARDVTVSASHLTDRRKAEATAANVKSTWEWFGRENQLAHRAGILPSSHSETFYANTRSVAFGNIISLNEQKLCSAKFGSADFASGIECSVVGYWGCSGGMVCSAEYSLGRWQLKVIGMFHGENTRGPDNLILAFSSRGVQELQKQAKQACKDTKQTFLSK